MQGQTMAEERDLSPTEPAPATRRWFHFRWRTLLVIPLAIALLALIYGPRQVRQRQTVLALKERQAIVRTDPVAIPLLPELAGEEYAVEVSEVYWRGPDTTDDDLTILAGLDSLQKLELGMAAIGDAGLAHLADCRGLYTLHLADTKITDAGLVHLKKLKNLGVLSLDRTAVSDAGLPHLAALAALERLFLDGTRVSDAGLAQIGRLEGLRELSLNGTKISDEGLKGLYGLKRLELVKLNETAVTLAGMQALQKALPRCHILIPGANE
jgi:Leucine-rich repeat (LRR) protein